MYEHICGFEKLGFALNRVSAQIFLCGVGFRGLGFRSLGFRVQGLGCRLKGLSVGFSVRLGSEVWSSDYKLKGVEGLEGVGNSHHSKTMTLA